MKCLLVLLTGLLVGLNAAAALVAPVTLDGTQQFAAWREPHGTWAVAGGVALNPKNARALVATPGQGVFLNSSGSRTINLVSVAEFGDCEVHLEFCVPQDSNSGVYLQGRYEIQILDSWGKVEVGPGDCGGIYQRWADNRGFEGQAPKLNAARSPGEWQSFDIVFRAPRFDGSGRKLLNARFVKVTLNGALVQENMEVTGPTRSAKFADEKPLGPLMLQGDHGPVAFRNLMIRPLVLD